MFTEMQLSIDLLQQESSRGAVFTTDARELQNSSWLLANPLNPPQFELRDYIAQDTKVVVLGYKRGKAKPTGRPCEIEFVHLWSLRDGRFTEFWVFNDTAALVEALRR